MNNKGEIVSAIGLSGIWGVHRNTIAAWVKRGCPYITKADRTRGVEWQFNTADVAHWRIDLAIQDTIGDTEQATETELNRRKLAAETTIAELKAATARGELGSIDDFQRQLTGQVIEVRKKLLQIPKRIEPTDRERRDAIADEILQALTALSNECGDN